MGTLGHSRTHRGSGVWGVTSGPQCLQTSPEMLRGLSSDQGEHRVLEGVAPLLQEECEQRLEICEDTQTSDRWGAFCPRLRDGRGGGSRPWSLEPQLCLSPQETTLKSYKSPCGKAFVEAFLCQRTFTLLDQLGSGDRKSVV